MEAIFPVLFAVLIALAIFESFTYTNRLRNMIEAWADRSELRIVSCERPWFSYGPYWFKSKSQRIYRVVVADPNGRERCAWLRCSTTFWSGERLEVEWEN